MSEVVSQSRSCFHCGLPVPPQAHFPVVIQGREESMCCPGCQAVAMAIVDGGLDGFYQFRTANSERAAISDQANWAIYDIPEVQADFVTLFSDGNRQANLLLEGLTCAACAWLIETHLKKNPHVVSVTVNTTDFRCALVVDASGSIAELMAALASIGYRPRPATDQQQQQLIHKENRISLIRIAVAFFGMMQAMMVAVGMYTGANDEWLNFLRWVSLVVATPVVLFSAYPFFHTAWRSIKMRYLVMDVPVALAIGLAYLASVFATIKGVGEVYFESVAMFTFFLLLGRYVELRARHRNRSAFSNLAQLMPVTACCLTQNDEIETPVPIKALAVNDRVLVRAGEPFPCDGLVVEGESAAVEALLTGESEPVIKRVGDQVIAGTLNQHSPLIVSVVAVGASTQLSAIERLAAQAANDKPRQIQVADQIARFFIARLLVICACVYAFWLWYQPEHAFWITLSVLVVTCPCALALAMPAALSAATANLRQRGFLVARGHVLETLAVVNRVIFDKTGTLTKGRFVIDKVELLADVGEDQVLALAAALEAGSNHPLAQAFTSYGSFSAQDVKQHTALGVEGIVKGQTYRLGRAEFALEQQSLAMPEGSQTWLLLASNEQPLAWIGLVDEVREEAKELIERLHSRGIKVDIASGDQLPAVQALAERLGVDSYIANAKPDHKLALLQQYQEAGDKVLMVGDGINDIPVLSGANVSVAMASASDLAQTRADAILLNEHLCVIDKSISLAIKTRIIIKQNLRYSLGYNVLAIPLAAAGFVTPWMAAIGMTASSLVVIFNALRLSK